MKINLVLMFEIHPKTAKQTYLFCKRYHTQPGTRLGLGPPKNILVIHHVQEKEIHIL